MLYFTALKPENLFPQLGVFSIASNFVPPLLFKKILTPFWHFRQTPPLQKEAEDTMGTQDFFKTKKVVLKPFSDRTHVRFRIISSFSVRFFMMLVLPNWLTEFFNWKMKVAKWSSHSKKTSFKQNLKSQAIRRIQSNLRNVQLGQKEKIYPVIRQNLITQNKLAFWIQSFILEICQMIS